MGIYKYNLSRLYLDLIDNLDSQIIGGLGILAVAPMVIIGVSLDEYSESLAVAIVLLGILSLLICIPLSYADSVGIKLMCPYVLAVLLIILLLDTALFTLSLPISVIMVAILDIYNIIHSIYDKQAEAKKVRDKAIADKLKAEEDYINKFRIELENEINRR